MKYLKFIFLGIIAASLFACEKGTKKESAQTLDSLQIQFKALNDSMATAWQEMIASDDLKLRYSKRLLQEVSYPGKYNHALYDSLTSLLASMPQQRYNSPESLSSAAIDTYDAATEQLKMGLIELSATMPGFEDCSICKELLRDIEKADNDVLVYRIRYDKHAQAYNEFIAANKDALAQINPSYETLPSRPLFQLTL